MNHLVDPKAWAERARITRMLPRHFKIMELALAGMNGPDIAKTLGMTSYSINMIMRSPIFQSELAYRRQEREKDDTLALDVQGIRGKAMSILEQASTKASDKLVSLLASQDDSVALRAGNSILDRVFGKGDKQTNSTIINITAENVQLLNAALAESRSLKELSHVESPVQPTHSTSAHSTQELPGDVYQAPEAGPEAGIGHRFVQEQDAGEVSKVA